MAFLPQGQEQQQQGQQANQNQIPTVPLIPSLAGSGGPSTGQGSGTGVQNTASPAGAPSSPWQNVTSYLQANAGQAGKVADVIGGNLTNQYNAANQGIQNAQTNFGQQIESARVPLDQQLAQQAATSPSSLISNPDQVSAFQKMFNANYTGPQDFSHTQDYSNLQSQIQKAQGQAALVNQGTPGLMTLLQQAESQGGRNPTQGITALDSLLLQEDPTNFSRISAAAQPFAGLTGYLGQTQTGLDTAAQNAAKEAAATQQTLQNQFLGPGGVAPTFQNTLSQALQDASKKATGYNQTIADILSNLNAGKALQSVYPYYVGQNVDPSGVLSTLNPYGTSTGVFQNMVAEGFSSPNYLTQYYTAPDQLTQPGLENVMTPQQFADAQALNQLIGQNAVSVPQQLGTQFSVPQGLGSFNSQGALQGLYDQLKAQQSYLPYMTPEQQTSWLGDINQLDAYLGNPSTQYPNPEPIEPTPPPTNTTDPLHPLPGGLGFV